MAGSIEAAHTIEKKTSVDLSESSLVDCSKENYGCSGGWSFKAMQHVVKEGISYTKDYPYNAR